MQNRAFSTTCHNCHNLYPCFPGHFDHRPFRTVSSFVHSKWCRKILRHKNREGGKCSHTHTHTRAKQRGKDRVRTIYAIFPSTLHLCGNPSPLPPGRGWKKETTVAAAAAWGFGSKSKSVFEFTAQYRHLLILPGPSRASSCPTPALCCDGQFWKDRVSFPHVLP